MNLTALGNRVEAHIHDRHERMAIVGFNSVNDDHSIFDVIKKLQNTFPSYEVRLLRPSKLDTADRRGIVIATEKNQINVDNVAIGTVYVVDSTNNLKRDLTRYVINND